MNKKLIFSLIIIVIVVIVFGFYLMRYALDPFGTPPEGSPNCGPEDRYKFDVKINSKEDFVNFIKTHEINQWVRLDNFKNITQDTNSLRMKLEVDWNKVLSEVKTEKVGSRIIYVLNYRPGKPFECGEFTLKMTSKGHVSVYGCCGK